MEEIRRYIEAIMESEKPDDDYETEIEETQGKGTFNFPWVFNDQRGIATAAFLREDEHLEVEVVGIFDKQGNAVKATNDMLEELRQQAWAYIDKA